MSFTTKYIKQTNDGLVDLIFRPSFIQLCALVKSVYLFVNELLPTITPRYDTTNIYIVLSRNQPVKPGDWGEKARPRLRYHQRVPVRTPACSDSDALAKGLDAPNAFSFRRWRWRSVETVTRERV